MKKIVSLLIALCIILQPVNCIAKEELNNNELYALSAALIDGSNGRLLYGKNQDEVRAMASTTKIMTLILALEYGNVDDIVTVSSYAAKMPDVQLGIKEGEQYKLDDLLYPMMLESHNDVAVVIAEHVGGDLDTFISMMNKKASELGLTNTYFLTPNGLDEENENGKHSSTAYEMCLIMKYCVVDSPVRDKFISICQTRSYTFSDYENKHVYTVNNKNAFLDMYDNVIAGKTGFTVDAGYCYVCAVRDGDKIFIATVLGSGWPGNKTYKWKDTKKLLDYGRANYDYKKIIDFTYETGTVFVENGIEASSSRLYINQEVELMLSEADKVEVVYEKKDKVSAPIYENDIISKIDIYINNQLYTTLNVYVSDTINKIDYRYCVKYIFSMFFNRR